MGTELPEIARPGDRFLRHIREPVVFRIAGLLDRHALDQAVDLANRKARQADVEVRIENLQLLQLLGQDVLIPSRELGQPVVGEDEGTLLGLVHVFKADAGHFRKAWTAEEYTCESDIGGVVRRLQRSA